MSVGVEREDRKTQQEVSSPREVRVGAKSLQDFGENDRDQPHVLDLEPPVEAAHLGRISSFEPVGCH